MPLPYTVEQVIGSETPSVLKLVNRLYVLGHEIRSSDALSEAISECVELLQARVRKGEEEAMAFLMAALQSFSIRELQQMNRDGVTWVLEVLFAIIECGIETGRHQDAVLTQRLRHGSFEDGDRFVDLEFCIIDGNRMLGKIALHRDIDGSCRWVATTRLRSVEWGKPL